MLRPRGAVAVDSLDPPFDREPFSKQATNVGRARHPVLVRRGRVRSASCSGPIRISRVSVIVLTGIYWYRQGRFDMSAEVPPTSSVMKLLNPAVLPLARLLLSTSTFWLCA